MQAALPPVSTQLSALPALFLVSVFDLCPAHHGPRLLPLGLWRPLRGSVSQLGSRAPLSAPFRSLPGLLLCRGW